VQPPAQGKRFHSFGEEANSPPKQGAGGERCETIPVCVAPELRPSFVSPYQAAFTQEESGNFVSKNLDPSLLKQNLLYHASASDSFIGRAADAASRIFVTRDDSGRRRLNTSYFLQVLTSVASATASRPYWARSTSSTFNNVGATIGSDAGLNFYREFGPGIRQMVKGHTPKFVSRLGNQITHGQTAKNGSPIPVR
jgi:hypothetical protein